MHPEQKVGRSKRPGRTNFSITCSATDHPNDMLFCTQCGSAIQDTHEYCGRCGKQVDSVALVPRGPRFQRIPNKGPGTVGSVGRFGQFFGLDPRVAFLTLIVDMMLNAGDLVSMGLLLPVSMAAGIALGFIVYRAQMNWYGDDKESARIKALILGLLTAIPTPIPEVLYIPAGILGWFHSFWRRKGSHT